LAEQQALDGTAGDLDDGRAIGDGDESDYGRRTISASKMIGFLPKKMASLWSAALNICKAHARAAVTALQSLGAMVPQGRVGHPSRSASSVRCSSFKQN